MLKNYWQIAWRNIVKRKGYSLLNIAGLAIGIAACLVLFTVVKYELSYDTFQPDYNRIYHVATVRVNGSEGRSYGEGMPFPAYDALKLSFPQLTVGPLYSAYNSQVTVLDAAAPNAFSAKKFLEESGVFFSDPAFFSVFRYAWLAGTPDVLKDPNATVLTKKAAEKYFGSWQAAVGGLLRIDNTADVKVEGVIDDPPANTDFPLSVIASYETVKAHPAAYNYTTDFGSVTSNFQTFVLLPQAVSVDDVNKQLVAFSNEHYNKNAKLNDKYINFLRPLKEVHFDGRFGTFGNHITTKATLWTLSLIGSFIILMACINFINLSTALAVGRSKEVGIRKVMGSSRPQLFWQMMGETGGLVFIALLLAFGLASLAIPYIKYVASIEETLRLLNVPTVCFLLLLALLVTVLAGTYPSAILSGFKPALALKNKITSAKVGGISLRRGLVIAQFAISQILIIGTIVAVSQMNYIQKADLGFNKDAVFVISSNADSTTTSRQAAFKQKLLSIGGIKAVSFSSDVPSSDNSSSGNFSYDHRPDESFDLFRKFGDEDYFKTYGLQMVAGRTYGKSDTAREVVVNETLVQKLGIKNPSAVLGHEIKIGRTANGPVWCVIVGVVKDFKTASLREAIKPTVIAERAKRYSYTGIKLNTASLQTTQTEIEKAWNEAYPEYVYNAYFLDKTINDFYKQETQLSLLYKIFAGIAVFISCLGLYGLVSFMATQRQKEVGIRKVLGASAANIVYLFSKEFTLLILLACLVAVPVAYFLMNNWLQNFAFRIELGTGVFALAIVASVMVAWLTVGYKSVKAAVSNPVKSLRSE